MIIDHHPTDQSLFAIETDMHEIPKLFAQMSKEANIMKFLGEPRLPPPEVSAKSPEVKK